MALTAKQARFVAEYLIDLNASAAARRAGYSDKRADAIGYENLRKPEISDAIRVAQQARAKRTEITQDRVLQEYAKLAFLDPRAFFDEKGSLIDVPSLPAEVAAALAGMDVANERDGEDAEGRAQYVQVRKIKFVDKKGALDSIARHLGMFVDKKQITGPNGGPLQAVSGSMEDLKKIARDLLNEV
jgi:phage terminase small subunit